MCCVYGKARLKINLAQIRPPARLCKNSVTPLASLFSFGYSRATGPE
jgi:hypothetical protein